MAFCISETIVSCLGFPGEAYAYPGAPGAKGQPGDSGYPGLSLKLSDPNLTLLPMSLSRLSYQYSLFVSPPGGPGNTGAQGDSGLPGSPGYPGTKGAPGEGGQPGITGDKYNSLLFSGFCLLMQS